MWPFSRADKIRDGLLEILRNHEAGLQGCFIVFSIDDFRFIQFSAIPNGLQLFWPNRNPVLREHYPEFRDLITRLGFSPIELAEPTREQIADIPPMRYAELPEEVFLQAGTDETTLLKLIKTTLTEVLKARKLSSIRVQVAKHA